MNVYELNQEDYVKIYTGSMKIRTFNIKRIFINLSVYICLLSTSCLAHEKNIGINLFFTPNGKICWLLLERKVFLKYLDIYLVNCLHFFIDTVKARIIC